MDNEALFNKLKEVVDGKINQYFGNGGLEVYRDGPGQEIVMSQDFARHLISYVEEINS